MKYHQLSLREMTYFDEAGFEAPFNLDLLQAENSNIDFDRYNTHSPIAYNACNITILE